MTKRYSIYLILVGLVAGAAFWNMYAVTHRSLLTVTPASAPGATTTPDGIRTNLAPAPSSTPSAGTPQTTAVTIPATGNGTVLEAMRAYAANSSFSFTGKEYPGMGFFVESINGKKNADGFYWFLYVNGVSSDTGASQTLLHPGDVVEWRYEISA